MTERAAHLVDEALPWVPVRQWVLTVPYRLRYQMAWNHGLSRAVLREYTRALLDVYRRGARARSIAGGQTGMVTALQRAGGALNANLHFHTLVLDGVFTAGPEGALTFHPAPGPSDAAVAAALTTIRLRVQRLLVRHGLEPADDATGSYAIEVPDDASEVCGAGHERRPAPARDGPPPYHLRPSVAADLDDAVGNLRNVRSRAARAFGSDEGDRDQKLD